MGDSLYLHRPKHTNAWFTNEMSSEAYDEFGAGKF